MARTVRDAKLETRTARAALKASAKPYYRAIDEGLHLGYRKGQTAGKWLMRRYVGGQSYTLEIIGTADDTIDADGAIVLSFSQAQAIARQRFVETKRVAAGLPTHGGPYAVRNAIGDYLAWLEQNRKTARDARWRAEGLILPELGDLACTKITTDRLRKWHEALAKQAPRLRTKKGAPQRHQAQDAEDDPEEAGRRRRATANRMLTILKAALNHAWREGRIPSDSTWRPVKPFKQADAARIRYLTIDESRRLINASDPDFRKLVQAALQSGARFGELAALTVGDFNPDSGTLYVRTSKSGQGRHVVLTEEGAVFFQGLAAGRSSRDRLLPKADGSRWLKSHQTRPMKEACDRAKIEPPANFHALRHTYASLTIMNGAPLMVVGRNLGHADTRMVEKHYGHLAPSYVANAIRAAAPRFGIEAEAKIVPIPSADCHAR
jgi:integrase